MLFNKDPVILCREKMASAFDIVRVTNANAMMKAWEINDRANYASLISDDFRMEIPSYGLDIRGIDSVWGVRLSMGADALNPHICASHTTPSEGVIECYVTVLDRTTGIVAQISNCRFVFDNVTEKVSHYWQSNVFPAPASAPPVAPAPINMETILIVGFTSSLRAKSANTGLLRACEANVPEGCTFEIIVPDIPLFNAEISAPEPDAVRAIRERAAKADAFVFACGELNFGIPAPMKNLLDWLSQGEGGNVWSDKPCAIIGAGGMMASCRGQGQFREIAVELNLHPLNKPQLLIPIFPDPRPFDMATGNLVSESHIGRCKVIMEALKAWTIRLSPK